MAVTLPSQSSSPGASCRGKAGHQHQLWIRSTPPPLSKHTGKAGVGAAAIPLEDCWANTESRS